MSSSQLTDLLLQVLHICVCVCVCVCDAEPLPGEGAAVPSVCSYLKCKLRPVLVWRKIFFLWNFIFNIQTDVWGNESPMTCLSSKVDLKLILQYASAECGQSDLQLFVFIKDANYKTVKQNFIKLFSKTNFCQEWECCNHRRRGGWRTGSTLTSDILEAPASRVLLETFLSGTPARRGQAPSNNSEQHRGRTTTNS